MMKKLMISSLAFLLAAASMQAQTGYAALKKDIHQSNKELTSAKKEKKEERKALRKLEGKEPTYQSKQQFYQDYGDVPNVTWKRTGYFDEATFLQHGIKTTAYYDFKNQLVGTTQPKTFTDLPAAAQKFINKKYKGYKAVKVILYDDNEDNDSDMLLYGHQFDDSDNYFVELQQGSKDIIVEVAMNGEVAFFTTM